MILYSQALKTWLRSNMGEERFTALFNIYKNMSINVNNIIYKFGKINQRRLNFVIEFSKLAISYKVLLLIINLL
jgi:hypothetical protein